MNAGIAAARIATALVPFRGLRRRLRKNLMDRARDARLARLAPAVAARYAEYSAACRRKLAAGIPLKVAFLVCDASMFSGESVFLEMRRDPRFRCEILVAPRTSRGETFMRATMEKTFATLAARYGSAVRPACSPDGKEAEPPDADIVFSTILYEDQSLPAFTVENLSRRSLVAILYYGYGGIFKSNGTKTPHLPNVALCWRFFASNRATAELFVNANPSLAGRILVPGYCKMDRLAEAIASAPPRSRKRILVCPHHTIDRPGDGSLAISTFLANADALLALPAEFPEADFTFRPHPLLFPKLAASGRWGARRAEAWLARMAAHPNVEMQEGGDYFATFAASDALLHDCGSFLAEYHYTGRPQCFMLESDALAEAQFLPFGRRLLEHSYVAKTRDEIREFVRRVALGGEDPMKEAREAFARAEVRVNHPRAAAETVEETLAALRCDDAKENGGMETV